MINPQELLLYVTYGPAWFCKSGPYSLLICFHVVFLCWSLEVLSSGSAGLICKAMGSSVGFHVMFLTQIGPQKASRSKVFTTADLFDISLVGLSGVRKQIWKNVCSTTTSFKSYAQMIALLPLYAFTSLSSFTDPELQLGVSSCWRLCNICEGEVQEV